MPPSKKTPLKAPAKLSALDAFASPKDAAKPGNPVARAQEAAPGGKTDARLGKTVRFTKAQWRKLRHLETDLEMTFHALCFEGLNRILAEHGIEPL
jgi:hypothetical protein